MAHASSTYLGEQRRRSTRVEQTVPVIIRGMDLLGQPFEERTATQSLSLHGCRYASKHHLPKNTWVTLEVPSGQKTKELRSVRARVAWIQRPRTLRELFQVGVEVEASGNVWNVAFQEQDRRGSQVEPIRPAVVTSDISNASGAMGGSTAETAASLEFYLEQAAGQSSGSEGGASGEESPLFQEFHHQLKFETQRVLEAARGAAEQAAEERTRRLHEDLREQMNSEHRTMAAAFREEWRREFEGREKEAQQRLSSEVARRVAEEAGRREEAPRSDAAEWEQKTESLRADMRAGLAAAATESEQRLDEKLSRQLQQLREELKSMAEQVPAAGGDAAAGASRETQGNLRTHLREEMDRARRQWNELIEASLDNAAQRLAGRWTEESQQILQAAVKKLASQTAELQTDSGLSAEAGRAALDEVKKSLSEEVARAKTSLAEIETSATRFSEYSRQLEAASQDSLNELRRHLEASVATQSAELERRAAEMQKKMVESAGPRLEEMGGRASARAAEEINARIAPLLERAGETARQLAAREQQAEELLHIHRERLRQVSEQAQREAAEHGSAMQANIQSDLEEARKGASLKWAAELETSAAQARQETAAALAKSSERQIQEGRSQIDAHVAEAVSFAAGGMAEAGGEAAQRFRAQVLDVSAAELDSAREHLQTAARGNLESASRCLSENAEMAAQAFRQRMETAAEDAARRSAAENDARGEKQRAQFTAEAEEHLRGLQASAENSLGKFEAQLTAQAEQELEKSRERFALQAEETLESFREQGQANLEEWVERQRRLEAEALRNHEDRLRSAGDSWVEAVLSKLDALSEKRMDSLIHDAEEAMRTACARVFEGLAQRMAGKVPGGAGEERNAGPPLSSNETAREQRASA